MRRLLFCFLSLFILESNGSALNLIKENVLSLTISDPLSILDQKTQEEFCKGTIEILVSKGDFFHRGTCGEEKSDS